MTILHSLDKKIETLNGTSVALGMFDGVHRGHGKVLMASVDHARESGTTPCVFTFALAKFGYDFKNAAQLTDHATTAKLLGEFGFEYALAPNFCAIRDLSAEAFVEQILHKIMSAKDLFCGENFTFAKGGKTDCTELSRIADFFGIKTHIIKTLLDGGEPISSTRIRALIAKGDTAEAGRLLGRGL